MKAKTDNHKDRTRSTAIIIIIIAALICIPVILFRAFTESTTEKITQTISLQYSKELNEQMSAHVASTFDYYFHELYTQYNALQLIEELDDEALSVFISGVQKSNDISYLAFADSEGYVHEADGTYLGTMRLSVLGELLNGKERIMADNVTIGSEDYIVIGASFDRSIRIGDRKISIAIIGMNDKDLAEHVVLHSEYSGSYSSIIHKDGSYVVKNTSEPYAGLNLFSILRKNYSVDNEDMIALEDSVSRNRSFFTDAVMNDTGDIVYIYVAPIENTDWFIVNNLPGTFIKANIISLRDSLERIYVIFVMLFILAGAFVVIQQTSSGRKLRKSQEELEAALKTAKEASGAKTSFLFNMSHDIRTPMNAILGYADIGSRHVDDAEISKDSYRKIKMAGGHLLNLINDVLEMSRIESGKMALDEKPLDMREAISEVTTMSESLAMAKGMDFRTVIGELKNPYVYADELHINEVIINLISNAVKYTHEEGRVRYSISQISDVKNGKALYRFEVSDNGMGMSEEFQTHLFETFSREQTTTISRTEGTGLGLSIVKKIVDMAGGVIHVHSVQNEGSVFTVEIPFRVLDQAEIEELISEKENYETDESAMDFSGKRVLLVEDNELNREIATYILEDAGFEVDTAEDGEIAVRAVSGKGSDYYDYILMDIQMPVMNGYEATARIRALPGGFRVPIIALSANAFEEDRKKSIEAGMNDHVAKPIDVKVLLKTMNGLTKAL